MRGGEKRKRGMPTSAVRIFAGQWKGRRLEVARAARPTSGKAREALFDVLGSRVYGARVLDLYAGSGAVGLEAVSRGALCAVLVDREAGALERNVARLSPVAGAVEVLRSEASQAIAQLRLRGERFEIVFADPPYEIGPAREIGEGIEHLLAPNGIFVVQGDAHGDLGPAPEGLRLQERRSYGRNVLTFFGSVGSVF